MTKIYVLSCQYDKHNSFGGKAIVKEQKEIQDLMEYTTLELYSYDTLVARITKNEETCLSTCELIPYTINGKNKTQTTTRHIKEFFRQFYLTDKEIKELFEKGIMEV